MNDKKRLRKAFCILRRVSFYCWLVFLTSMIIGLISGISWMLEMAAVSGLLAFGCINASDLCVYRADELEQREDSDTIKES